MATWLKDLGVCNYDFKGIYPYNQYKDNIDIDNIFTKFNEFVGKELNTFFEAFKENTRLEFNNASGYAQFYLLYYYGIKNKGSTLNVVPNFYDSGYIRYESNNDNGNPYRYDDYARPTDAVKYLNQMTWKITACMAAWSLDRRHQVFSIPVLFELFNRIYKVYRNSETENYDFNEIDIEDTGKTINVTLPANDLWKFVQQVAMSSSNLLLNLPYGRKIEIFVKEVENKDETS